MLPDPWPAPVAGGPVAASVRVPGSKSMANRALVLAALASGPSRIGGLPIGARDLALMTAALRALGATVVESDSGAVTVRPGWSGGDATVDCGLAGTVMRFVPPLAGLRDGATSFDGDPRARERPMAASIAALRQLGIAVADGDRSRLPFAVIGSGHVPGGPVTVDASSSSQFVSALLLAGARFDAGVTVRHEGGPVPSLPHIEMTCRMLTDHSVTVLADSEDRTAATWQVLPGPVRPFDRVVEPDLSNALPFAAMALVTGGTVTVEGLPVPSVQPVAPVLDLLRTMGARADLTTAGLVVRGTGRVAGIDVDLRDLGELVPTITALAVLADGPSRLRGIAHVAGHETDRLAALASEVNALGGSVTADDDGLTIRPRSLRGGIWRTYADHRMATAGAIVGLRVPGVLIEDVATTVKTFPEFPDRWSAALGSV